jgi:hypothetical protein
MLKNAMATDENGYLIEDPKGFECFSIRKIMKKCNEVLVNGVYF